MEVVPVCHAYGLGLIPYSPLAGGLLGGAIDQPLEGRRATDRFKKDLEKHRSQLLTYNSFCDSLGESPANVALAWLLHNPVVTAPIIGPRTIEQLEESLQALNIMFSNENLVKLNEIWPGPGGEAPEAYAW